MEPGPAEQTVIDLLEALRSFGGLQFEYTLHSSGTPASPLLEVTLSGPDTPLLLDRNGELLHAIESVAAGILRLLPEQQEQLSFDAAGFKAQRAMAIARSAEQAIERVRSTGQAHTFPPMNSRERRLLHLALSTSGLATASSGEGPRRFVVLYPEGETPRPEAFAPPTPDPRRSRFGGRPNRPFSGPRRPSPASARPPQSEPASPFAEPDGNRAAPGHPPPPAAGDAREQSIRRAFRKR